METQKLNNGATINVTGSGGGSRDEFKWNGGLSCAMRDQRDAVEMDNGNSSIPL